MTAGRCIPHLFRAAVVAEDSLFHGLHLNQAVN
jgi:hypothetical protein